MTAKAATAYTPMYTTGAPGHPACPVCGRPLPVQPETGRKSGKPFLMLRCSQDGRRLRAFITDQAHVATVVRKLETSVAAMGAKPAPAVAARASHEAVATAGKEGGP